MDDVSCSDQEEDGLQNFQLLHSNIHQDLQGSQGRLHTLLWRQGRREGRREGRRGRGEGDREGKERGREAGKEGEREAGREGKREGGRETGREGEREGEREKEGNIPTKDYTRMTFIKPTYFKMD